MTQNPNLTLPDMFRRFADLTQFWYRHTASSELAQREFQEYSRLLTDIPCQIERLIAFADVGTTAMFDDVAKVHADPPREDAGQGWRFLTQGETVQAGDECWHSCDRWEPCDFTIGTKCDKRQARLFLYRRRIAKDTPKDTAGHIVPPSQGKREETPVTAQETASEEAWRMLEAGELIEEDDEVLGTNEWFPVSPLSIGVAVSDGYQNDFRRRVTPPSPAKEQP